jgi:O-antigen ligase
VYWLVLAETGYVGLVAFLLLLARPLFMAFRMAWLHPRDWRGDILLGLGVALLVVYTHSLVEWTFVTFQVQYPFGATIGLIAGLAQQLRSPGGRPATSQVFAGEVELTRASRGKRSPPRTQEDWPT